MNPEPPPAPVLTPTTTLNSTVEVLNQKNASALTHKIRSVLQKSNSWHRFIIFDAAKLDRDRVMKNVLDIVHPLDLFPVGCKADGNNVTFIARNCGPAIEKLCRQNLILPLKDGSPLILNVILDLFKPEEANIGVQELVSRIVHKRYNKLTKTLNLESLHNDLDLRDKIYCSLSQPKIMTFVLSIARPLNIVCLKLCNNDLKSLTPLEIIWSCRSITTLDLRNNLIENMISLNVLKNMHITDLTLEGNPVCQNYEETGYIRAVKELCPHIEKLDGVLLGVSGFPALRRNYLVNIENHDFVDQFLEHYFTLYDSNNRISLTQIYHKNAMFSLTCSYLAGHISSNSAELEVYKSKSRNLKTISDLSKVAKTLYTGRNEIINLLRTLPTSEHDPYMFTVDLVNYTEKQAVITVTGVFREPGVRFLDTDKLFGFYRTFVLLAVGNGEYNIINEQLHITNATSIQSQRAFKMVKVARSTKTNYTNIEKQEIIKTMSKISTLNFQWSEKFLQDRNWDLKAALTHFVELYKDEKIPPEAFVS